MAREKKAKMDTKRSEIEDALDAAPERDGPEMHAAASLEQAGTWVPGHLFLGSKNCEKRTMRNES